LVKDLAIVEVYERVAIEEGLKIYFGMLGIISIADQWFTDIAL
jgi:hypothetical protein